MVIRLSILNITTAAVIFGSNICMFNLRIAQCIMSTDAFLSIILPLQQNFVRLELLDIQ